MKASTLTLVVTLAMLQTAPPAPQGPQRGQAPNTQSSQAPLNAAECKCSIEVTVKRPSGEAISDVDITVTQAPLAPRVQIDASGAAQVIQTPAPAAGTAPPVLTATTDNSGRAVFRELAEGSYSILARNDGYFAVVNDAYPQQVSVTVPVGPAPAQTVARPTPPPGAIVVPVRQPIQQITLLMVKGATIAGRVLDKNNRPASAIQVGAYRVNYQNGHRVLTQMGSAVQSDDRGEYRLYWFPPGEYYVRTGAARTLLLAGVAGVNYPSVTYYPGTQDERSLTPLIVAEAASLTGIDIAMKAPTGVTISGTIVNTIPGGRVGPQGQVIRTVSSVFLVPRNSVFFDNPTLIPIIGGAGARGANPLNDSETRFEIHGVPPGTYDLYPVYNDPSTAARGSVPGYYFARTPIEVGSEDVTGIQSVIQTGANLTGHVAITGTPPAAVPNRPAQPLNVTNVRLQMQPRENLPSLVRLGLTGFTMIGADGAFSMVNLVDGQYSLMGVLGMPADAYVSEILLDSRSVFDAGIITIGKGSQVNMEVVVSRGGGTIQGTVQDSKHNLVPAIRITLIPDLPRRGNALLYKTATSNPMGVFNFNGIAPGSYKLFAWEHNTASAEQDPDFIRDYDILGTPVSVSAGLPLANIQVTPIPSKH